jgi:hypothetical protein
MEFGVVIQRVPKYPQNAVAVRTQLWFENVKYAWMLNWLTKAHDGNLHTRLFSPYMGCTCSRVYEHNCRLSTH